MKQVFYKMLKEVCVSLNLIPRTSDYIEFSHDLVTQYIRLNKTQLENLYILLQSGVSISPDNQKEIIKLNINIDILNSLLSEHTLTEANYLLCLKKSVEIIDNKADSILKTKFEFDSFIINYDLKKKYKSYYKKINAKGYLESSNYFRELTGILRTSENYMSPKLTKFYINTCKEWIYNKEKFKRTIKANMRLYWISEILYHQTTKKPQRSFFSARRILDFSQTNKNFNIIFALKIKMHSNNFLETKMFSEEEKKMLTTPPESIEELNNSLEVLDKLGTIDKLSDVCFCSFLSRFISSPSSCIEEESWLIIYSELEKYFDKVDFKLLKMLGEDTYFCSSIFGYDDMFFVDELISKLKTKKPTVKKSTLVKALKLSTKSGCSPRNFFYTVKSKKVLLV